MFAVFDIGGSSVKHALMDEHAEIHNSGSYPTPQDNLESLVDSLVDVLNTYKQGQTIGGIAISAPCVVEASENRVSKSGALEYLDGFNLRDLLKERTGLPIRIENDANCAGLAECFKGNGQDSNYFVVLVLGSGIGGTIVLNKRILHGKNLHGGEFGYMIIDDPLSEPFGEMLSSKASTGGLISSVAAALDVDPKTLNGKRIFEMAENGDSVVQHELDKFYKYLAVGVYNVAYSLDPEKILIGGAISQSKALFDGVNGYLKQMKSRYHLLNISVEPCYFQDKANLVGALYNFMDREGLLRR